MYCWQCIDVAKILLPQERLTLKHKNTSKWAKRALRRGINVMDEATKDAMQEQLRLGMQLRQKVYRSTNEHIRVSVDRCLLQMS